MAGFALLAVGLVAAGLLLDRSMRLGARRRAAAELDSVASLKVAAIAAWCEEHTRNASYAATFPSIQEVVAAAAKGSIEPGLRAHAVGVLAHLGTRQGYLRLALISEQGRVLLDWQPVGEPARPFQPGLLQRAFGGGGASAAELIEHEGPEVLWLELAVPIERAGASPIVLALRAGMGTFFDTAVGAWPVPSETATAALVRMDGDGAKVILPRSEPTGRASTLTVVTSAVGPTLRRAIRGEVGVTPGVGLLGKQALSAARPVMSTGWAVVAQMELAEIEAPLIRPALVIFSLMGALLLVGAAMLALWWRQEGARARVEEALRESEDRFRLALAGTHFVWDWDLTEGRLEVDGAWAEAMGRTERSVRGTEREILAFICHPDDVTSVLARLHAHVRGEVPSTDVEFRTVLKNGSVRWVQARGRASRRDASGLALRITGVVSDVTDRRALQAQVERSERMASLGTLAAGLAHEVNNPLAAVLANLDVLTRELAGAGRPSVTELLAETRDGAERVRDVMRNLRAFARPDSEGRVVADVRSEIEAAVRLTRNELRHRARLEVEVGALPPVASSGHQLGQVFLNLLTNAAQAIPEGHAEANLVSLRATTGPDGWARVEVRDTGAGIAPEVLKRIFEPFFTTKEQGVGTGLGLAIVHSIVMAAGGRLEVESRLGAGSTFRVLLPPAAAPAPPRPAVATPKPGAAGRRRLLLVDDDPLVARALVRVLRRAHEVSVAASGDEALARLEGGERYDAILCDLMMPQMSGMELHARLAERHPGQAGRMIFVTGGAFTEGASEFLRSVAATCLEKPIDPRLLAEAIERVAGGGGADGGATGTPTEHAS